MISHQNAIFCSTCGEFKDIPLTANEVKCEKCKVSVPLTEIELNFFEESKEYKIEKKWLQEEQKEEEEARDLKTIEQKCVNPKCDSNLCYYTARQLRSADEGQTVFYHCVKCGERFTLNT